MNLGDIIKTKNYKCLWCDNDEFYIKDMVYADIYLILYCTNKDCGCTQCVKKEDILNEVQSNNKMSKV